MITVSYNAYCAISKEGDNDIWTVRPRGVVPLLPLCSQIDVGATANTLLGDTFSLENNTHGSQFHDRDPQLASQILGAKTQSCYIGTRDIRSRVIRGPYCTSKGNLGNSAKILQILYHFIIFFGCITKLLSILKIECWHLFHCGLTHCGLVMTYGDKELGQNWGNMILHTTMQ